MTPNLEQIKSLIRWFLTYVGGIVTGYVTAKNWLTADQLQQVASFFTSETVVTLISSMGVGIWGLFVHSQKNAVTVVDTMAKQPDSPVKAVIVEPTAEGVALAKSVGSSTTVVAGSSTAADAASRKENIK